MIKPQDIVVLLKVATVDRWVLTYEALSLATGISASEVHKGLKRAEVARLYDSHHQRPIRQNLLEFLVHGVPYAFAPIRGPITRGIPTSFAAPLFDDSFFYPEGEAPVWPHPEGTARGYSLSPLYRSVPDVAPRDEAFYALLALVDAVREGRARERHQAVELLTKRLSNIAT